MLDRIKQRTPATGRLSKISCLIGSRGTARVAKNRLAEMKVGQVAEIF